MHFCNRPAATSIRWRRNAVTLGIEGLISVTVFQAMMGLVLRPRRLRMAALRGACVLLGEWRGSESSKREHR